MNRKFLQAAALILGLLATQACSDAIDETPPGVDPNPTPNPNPPGPKDPEPLPNDPDECPDNATWDSADERCVCDNGFIHEGAQCVEPIPKKACLLISSTDWATSGSLSIYDIEAEELLSDVTTYHQDSVIRVLNDEIYVVQRMYGDAVMKLDDSDHYAILWEESIRLQGLSAPNPTDMVRVGEYLYLPLYNDGRIVQANVNPLTSGAFLTGLQARITPASWEGAFANLNRLTVENGVLFGLTEGLGDDWSCGSMNSGSPNRSRIYAFDPETLEPKAVFANGQTYVELNFCNATGWVPMGDGKYLVHSLGNYRSINGTDNDGGLEIIDLAAPTTPVVIAAEETDFGPVDIFGAHIVDGDVYVTLIDENYLPIYLHRVDTSGTGRWSLESDAHDRGHLYDGYIGAVQGVGDELFVVNRDWGSESVVRIDRYTGEPTGDPILTAIAPETLNIFYREESCW